MSDPLFTRVTYRGLDYKVIAYHDKNDTYELRPMEPYPGKDRKNIFVPSELIK